MAETKTEEITEAPEPSADDRLARAWEQVRNLSLYRKIALL